MAAGHAPAFRDHGIGLLSFENFQFSQFAIRAREFQFVNFDRIGLPFRIELELEAIARWIIRRTGRTGTSDPSARVRWKSRFIHAETCNARTVLGRASK